jgi:hypothetical protein
VRPLRKEGASSFRLPLKKIGGDTPLDEWHPELTGSVTAPRPRPLSPAEKAALQHQVREWLAKGVIRKTNTTAWRNNVVFVAKKNGKLRVCIDCRPSNEVTRDYEWPLPRLQDLRHHVSGSAWFARLDLSDAFFRIKVPRVWRYLTTFQESDDYYEFLRMPFGLKTAPATFQKFMDYGLKDHRRYAMWYIDDILISANTLKELRARVAQVKTTLRKMKCEVNEQKSTYDKQSLLFAGIWITKTSTGPNIDKVREALALPTPRTKTELRSALGLVSYLRDYIPLVSLLTARLQPNRTEQIDYADLEHHWAKLRNHLAERATTLGQWHEDEDAQLYTDASNIGLGAILLQNGRIIAVASRKLSPAETRYSTTDREHLSLVFAAQRFRLFLHRHTAETRAYNDHAANVSRNEANFTARQARWHNIIGQCIPAIRHVKGCLNPADYCSRWLVPKIGGLEIMLTA